MYSPKLERDWGYYSPAQNKIVLHTRQEKTFFHELGMPLMLSLQSRKRDKMPNRKLLPSL
ncbi:MAG TPA: hypothetical protein DDW65_11295 [Firmicutes bacterium]|nr:hypothetical protein [Bacillota bacterium]